ncbi:MAG: hypothetical protein R2806_10945 [Saprospiraceae bacterium]
MISFGEGTGFIKHDGGDLARIFKGRPVARSIDRYWRKHWLKMAATSGMARPRACGQRMYHRDHTFECKSQIPALKQPNAQGGDAR